MTTQVDAVTKHNAQVSPDFRTVCDDLTIYINGVGEVRIINAVRQSERIVGDIYSMWKVLIERQDTFRPFVIWTLAATEKGFAAQTGFYFATLDEAQKVFNNE